MTRAALAAALAAVLLPLAACSSDQEQYCDAVEEHQTELTDITSQGGPDALLEALPVYRDLRDQAPSRHPRRVGPGRHQPRGACSPRSTTPASTPRTTTRRTPSLPQDDREAIRAAADGLASAETARAFDAVDQQARDVCHTPLGL